MLFIDAVHVRRRCANRFRVLVKPHAVGIAFVACLVYSQDDVTQVRVKSPHKLTRVYIAKIPRPDRSLNRFKDRIFADTLRPAHNHSVIDFFARSFHTMRKPQNQVLGLVRV